MATYVVHHSYPFRKPGYVAEVKSISSEIIHFTDGGCVSTYDQTSSLKKHDVFPGDKLKFVAPYKDGSVYYEVEHLRNGSPVSQITTTGETMAKIYDAAVLQTKTVPAGEGVSTGVAVQEVVHIRSNFTSVSDEIAKATVIAEAVAKGVVVDDPLKPIEVRLRSW